MQFIKGGVDTKAYSTAELLDVDIVTQCAGTEFQNHYVILNFKEDVSVEVYSNDEYWLARYMYEIILEELNTGKNVWIGDLMSKHARTLERIRRRKEKRKSKS